MHTVISDYSMATKKGKGLVGDRKKLDVRGKFLNSSKEVAFGHRSEGCKETTQRVLEKAFQAQGMAVCEKTLR